MLKLTTVLLAGVAMAGCSGDDPSEPEHLTPSPTSERSFNPATDCPTDMIIGLGTPLNDGRSPGATTPEEAAAGQARVFVNHHGPVTAHIVSQTGKKAQIRYDNATGPVAQVEVVKQAGKPGWFMNSGQECSPAPAPK